MTSWAGSPPAPSRAADEACLAKELARGAGGLGDPVAEEDERVAGGEAPAGGLEGEPGHGADHEAAGHRQPAPAPAGPGVGREGPPVPVAEGAAPAVEDTAEERHERGLVVHEGLVHPCEKLVERPPTQGLGAEERHAARHEERGAHPLARHVSDCEEEVPFVEEERVVEVAAHLRRRVHRRCAVHLGSVREEDPRPGEHARLDLAGEAELLAHLLPGRLPLEVQAETGAQEAQEAAGEAGQGKTGPENTFSSGTRRISQALAATTHAEAGRPSMTAISPKHSPGSTRLTVPEASSRRTSTCPSRTKWSARWCSPGRRTTSPGPRRTTRPAPRIAWSDSGATPSKYGLRASASRPLTPPRSGPRGRARG